ncbi:unnamed protein product [Cylicocyclus nassatus]|uniref:Uncharacterized protein n=1 Tax=Cylicocyclus nassatus TaxID=53992 RepID=A0AA36GFJ7_CYLNA|nr:unnamed protein product [Cylicocyclus nassatus]
MLVLPDSGYNSPCDGIFPTSSALSPSKLLPAISSKICRKVDFATGLYSNTEYDTTHIACKFRSREIASRLLLLCDLFDSEFAYFQEQGVSWTASIMRLFGC